MWAVKKAVPSWIRADVKMAGETALHWAAKRGHEDTVKVLLRFRADPLAVDDADTTPGNDCFRPFSSYILCKRLLIAMWR